MEYIKLSPTVKFGDCFALCSYLSVYQSQYNKYTLRLYDKFSHERKITCNYPALLKTLAVLDFQKYTDVYVFGHTNVVPHHFEMIFEISYNYITDSRCIKLY